MENSTKKQYQEFLMDKHLRIGYFAHWFQPAYTTEDFLHDLGVNAEKIDYSQKNYLEKYDVAIIEQNGFNDYIENDELYIRDWVKRGGICLFLHQDYMRWAPYFLPDELGYTQLIHRHVNTILDYRTYMMPWIEEAGKELFESPGRITPDEMLDWYVPANSFGIAAGPDQCKPEIFRTAAQSCFLANPAWEILGSYLDPAVRDGALILRGKYGKGMYFLNQLMRPEERVAENDRCFRFWKKYLPNLLAYFARFKDNMPAPAPIPAASSLPPKKIHKMAIHMHSLDWYGCDSMPGTMNALMRYKNFDICALSVKDTAPYGGKLDPACFSDDHALFLDGQEYHPFNWNDKHEHLGHNNYHMLAIGIDSDAYTAEFTRSLFSDAEVDAYLKKALAHIRDHGGASCATHPWCGYWHDYPFDAVDYEELKTISGTDIEKYWLSGGKITLMNSVDLFGTRSFYDNPALNFLCLHGEPPCRDNVVKAIKAGHNIAAAFFDEADIMLGDALPGDTVSARNAAEQELKIRAKISTGKIRHIRVYSGADVIWQSEEQNAEIRRSVSLSGLTLNKFIRVEIEGDKPVHIVCSTPFYLE